MVANKGSGVSVTDFAVPSSMPQKSRSTRRHDHRFYSSRSTPLPSRPASPTQDDDDPASYGVSELRDGFFDAYFLPPPPPGSAGSDLKSTLPPQFDKSHPLSVRAFIPRQLHGLRAASRRVVTTRAGIPLARSCAAFFAAYALCLVPAARAWLGSCAYVACVSVLVNHPGRTVGAQLDGALLTTVGTALGLGWGTVGLLLSTSTATASEGFGGILALFMAVFMAAIAIVRSHFVRLYQAVMCAGLAICYTCLADVSAGRVPWAKLWDYGRPWLVGQAIALVANLVIVPDAGARPLAMALHDAFLTMDVSSFPNSPYLSLHSNTHVRPS